MPIHFESLSLRQLLWGCIQSYCFVKYFQNVIYIFLCMGYMKTTMIDPCQCQHESDDWVPMGVKSREWSQIQPVILESFLYFQRKSASRISGYGNQIFFQLKQCFLQRICWINSFTFGVRNNTISIAHKQQSFGRVNSIQCSNFSVVSYIKQENNKIILQTKRALLKLLSIYFTPLINEFNFFFLCILMLSFNGVIEGIIGAEFLKI